MPQTLTSIIDAWEYYAAEDFQGILTRFSGETDPEISALVRLARLETGKNDIQDQNAATAFTSLEKGMRAFLSGDFHAASRELYEHLTEKEYFSEHILDRFLRAAEISGNFEMLFAIALKYSTWKSYQEKLAGPLFYGAYYLQKYTDALKIFEKNHALLANTDALFKVAHCLLSLKEYRRAENLLIKLHNRVTGAPYQANYAELEERYRPLVARLPELSKKKLSRKEAWQIGMAYMINQDYNKALSIFEELLKAA